MLVSIVSVIVVILVMFVLVYMLIFRAQKDWDKILCMFALPLIIVTPGIVLSNLERDQKRNLYGPSFYKNGQWYYGVSNQGK